jgi:hypothetical protein
MNKIRKYILTQSSQRLESFDLLIKFYCPRICSLNCSRLVLVWLLLMFLLAEVSRGCLLLLLLLVLLVLLLVQFIVLVLVIVLLHFQ